MNSVQLEIEAKAVILGSWWRKHNTHLDQGRLFLRYQWTKLKSWTCEVIKLLSILSAVCKTPGFTTLESLWEQALPKILAPEDCHCWMGRKRRQKCSVKIFWPFIFFNGDQVSKTCIKLQKILKTGKMFSKLWGVLFSLKGFILSYTILFFLRNSKEACKCRTSEWNEWMSSQDKVLKMESSSSDRQTDREIYSGQCFPWPGCGRLPSHPLSPGSRVWHSTTDSSSDEQPLGLLQLNRTVTLLKLSVYKTNLCKCLIHQNPQWVMAAALQS